jgi:hypothetical protein
LQEKLDDKVLKTRLVLSNNYEELSIRKVKPLNILAFVLVSLLAKAELLVSLSAKVESCYVTVVSLLAKTELCYAFVRIDSSCALEIAVQVC